MRYCKKCLQPDTRPNIMFDDNQVCYACLYEESKKSINWEKRREELQKIADDAKKERKIRGISYDCVIGVSGGKDSTFQAVYAKEKLGLHPLLVNCLPDEITEVGRKNLNNLSNLGFDIISIRPNPVLAKKLARECFFKRGNIVVASEFCLWASAYIMANKFNIPLIIQGENAALTLGAAKKQAGGDDAYSVVDLDTLKGADAKSLLGEDIDVSFDEMFFYQMPDVSEMKEKGIRAIFIQYYLSEWSQVGNERFAVARGLMGRTTEDLHDLGGYYRYSGVDSDLGIVNQMIKYLKFGFGATTDQVCYDIREGRMTREDAVWYVNEYDGKCGEQYIESVCKYLSITKEEFWEVVDKYVNKKLFEKNSSGNWIPKFKVGIDFDM